MTVWNRVIVTIVVHEIRHKGDVVHFLKVFKIDYKLNASITALIMPNIITLPSESALPAL